VLVVVVELILGGMLSLAGRKDLQHSERVVCLVVVVVVVVVVVRFYTRQQVMI